MQHVENINHTKIVTSCNRVERMLEFNFMDIDGDFGALEVMKTTSMVQVKMADDDCFDVTNLESTFFNLYIQFLVCFVVDLGKDVVDWSTPNLGIIFSGPGFPEDEAFFWMINQDGILNELSALRLGRTGLG